MLNFSIGTEYEPLKAAVRAVTLTSLHGLKDYDVST